MNNRILTICLALVLQPLLALAQQSEPQRTVYEIESIILSCPTGQVDLAASQMASAVRENKFDKSCLPKEAVLLSTPTIMILADEPAIILVGPTEPVQYFEKKSDGSYRLREMPDSESVGINLRYNISTKPGNGYDDVEAEFTIKTIRERVKIPDVNLGVGKPVILNSRRSLSLSLPIEASSQWWGWYAVSASSQDSTNAVLDLFRIRLGQKPDPRLLREIPAQQLNRGNGQ
jgi:hypothetical protein